HNRTYAFNRQGNRCYGYFGIVCTNASQTTYRSGIPAPEGDQKDRASGYELCQTSREGSKLDKPVNSIQQSTNFLFHRLPFLTLFCQVSYWVATEIVLTKTVKDQVSLVKKFVLLCRELYTMSNFNTLMEILAGLNHVAVQRLKRMWEVSTVFTGFIE